MIFWWNYGMYHISTSFVNIISLFLISHWPHSSWVKLSFYDLVLPSSVSINVLYFIGIQICKNCCFVSNSFFCWGVLFVLFVWSWESKIDHINNITHGFSLFMVSTLAIYAEFFRSLGPSTWSQHASV